MDDAMNSLFRKLSWIRKRSVRRFLAAYWVIREAARIPAQEINNRVRLINVVSDFGAVNQIVNGNEIKAGTEFIPEKPLCNLGEVEGVKKYKKRQMAEPLEDPAVIGFIRKNEEEDRKKNTEVEVEGHIIQKTQTENAQGIRQGVIHEAP